MHDIELDDQFWRAALTALADGSRASAVSVAYPDYAELVAAIEADAESDAVLVGVRPSSERAGPRLLALTTAAFLARARVPTLLVDLGRDLRWIERAVGEDLKEGLIDHIEYGIPLERCVRPTSTRGLSVLTGGAVFLTGSPCEHAPAFRSALDRLKQRFRVLVVALPADDAAADRACSPALVDVLVAVEDRDAAVTTLGSERAVVHLAGDPAAADDLVRLCHRFLGPLTALIERGAAAGAPREGVAPLEPAPDGEEMPGLFGEAAEEREDLAFLELFGESAPEASDRAWETDIDEPEDAAPRRRDGAVAGRTKRAVAALAVVAVAGVAIAVGPSRLAPLFAGWFGDAAADDRIVARVDRAGEDAGIRDMGTEKGALVPLDPAAVTAEAEEAGSAEEPVAPATPPPAGPAGWALHVGSFQDAAVARRVAGRVTSGSLPAYVVPVEIPDRGRWHRVLAGLFADSTAARAALEELLAAGRVDDGAVRSTPLAYELGSYADRAALEARSAELADLGVSSYATGAGPFTLWAGAFADRSDAGALGEVLAEAGVEANLIERSR